MLEKLGMFLGRKELHVRKESYAHLLQQTAFIVWPRSLESRVGCDISQRVIISSCVLYLFIIPSSLKNDLRQNLSK